MAPWRRPWLPDGAHGSLREPAYEKQAGSLREPIHWKIGNMNAPQGPKITKTKTPGGSLPIARELA